MKQIDIRDVKYDTIYCYYQQYETTKYLAFVKFLGRDHDDHNEYVFIDICPYYKSMNGQVIVCGPDEEFEVTLPIDNEDGDCIEIFEMTEDEINRHVMMEFI